MKNVLVTGGNDGIGRAIAEKFLREGFRVLVLDRRIDHWPSAKDSPGGDVCGNPGETPSLPPAPDGYACDIRDTENLKSCFQEILGKYKTLDILVNAAGIQIVEKFADYDAARWKTILDTNYFGTCNVISEALRLLSRGGAILNLLSVHSNRPRQGKIAYDCSKSALEMLTKELALELAPRGITVNGLSFGAVETRMNAEWEEHPEQREEAKKKVPLGVIFRPEDIARFGYCICTELAPYTTGSIFVVDGGRSLL